eukprot:jgi/Psemu1/15803/gm1.15803_g
MEQTNRNHLLADAGSYADAEDDGYGRVRDPNFHDWDYCNRRRRHRSRVRLLFSLDAKNNSTNNKNMNGNGNGDDDDDCYDPGWDSHAAVTCLRPMLPSPLREMTYTPRTGWNYGPASRNAPGWDRLGTGIAERIPVAVAVAVSKRRTRTHHSTADAATATSADGDSEALRVPMPSTTMITPLSWMSGLASNSGATKKAGTNRSPVESRAALPERKRAGNPAGSFPPGKRQKSSDAASVVTQSTAGESASSSAFANATMDRKVDRIVSVPPGKKVDGSAAVTVTKDLPPSRAAAASTKPAASSSGAGAPSISPKAALHQWYGKKPRKTQIRPEHYVTWDNGKTTYEQRFTTVFLCPMTKEAFLAGPWSGAGFGGGKPVPLASTAVAPDADGLYWFPRKIMAEHAAAARAWDCWVMREPGRFDEPFRSLRFGKLEPYWPSQRPACPLNRMPATVREQFPSTDGYSGAAATHPASNTARCNDDGSANNDTNSSQTGANPTVPIQAQTTAVSGAVGNDPGTKSTKHATTTVTTIAATTITPGGSDTNNSNNSSNSNSNSNQRKPSWGETGPGTGRDAGRHQTRKHPSWDTKRNNSTDTNKDFTRNKKNREREQVVVRMVDKPTIISHSTGTSNHRTKSLLRTTPLRFQLPRDRRMNRDLWSQWQRCSILPRNRCLGKINTTSRRIRSKINVCSNQQTTIRSRMLTPHICINNLINYSIINNNQINSRINNIIINNNHNNIPNRSVSNSTITISTVSNKSISINKISNSSISMNKICNCLVNTYQYKRRQPRRNPLPLDLRAIITRRGTMNNRMRILMLLLKATTTQIDLRAVR